MAQGKAKFIPLYVDWYEYDNEENFKAWQESLGSEYREVTNDNFEKLQPGDIIVRGKDVFEENAPYEFSYVPKDEWDTLFIKLDSNGVPLTLTSSSCCAHGHCTCGGENES